MWGRLKKNCRRHGSFLMDKRTGLLAAGRQASRFSPMLVSAVLALLCFVLTSCVAVEKKSSPIAGKLLAAEAVSFNQDARVSIFLNLKDPTVPAVRMQISGLAIRGKGVWQPLTDEKLVVDAGVMGNGQMFMARAGLAAGVYDGVRFTVERGSLHRGGDDLFLALETPRVEIIFSGPFSLAKGDSKSIAISWDVESSLRGGAILTPVMTASPLAVPLIADLAYVACPDIDTVYMVRTDKNWVCGSLGVSGRPLYLEARPATNRLYVLAAAEPSIKVYEMSTSQLVDVIHLPMSRDPDLMVFSPDGLWAYVLEQRSRYLNRVNLSSGGLDKRVRLGERPGYMLYLNELGGRLAVSDLYTHKVLLLDPETLETRTNIEVGSAPRGLLLWKKSLYVAESGTNMVTAYDLDSHRQENSINVSFLPRRMLLVDEGGAENTNIYVANVDSSSLSVLIAGQPNVVDEIQLRGRPGEMAYSPNHRWLYAGNAEYGGLTVVGLISNRETDFIDLRAVPVGLQVIE